MKAVIDRFEGEWAVLEVEGKRMWNVPKDFLPVQAKEGDLVDFFFDIKPSKKNVNEKLMEQVFE